MEEKRALITFFMPPEGCIDGTGVGVSYVLCYKDSKDLMEYIEQERKMLNFIPEDNNGFIIIPLLNEEDYYEHEIKWLGNWDCD